MFTICGVKELPFFCFKQYFLLYAQKHCTETVFQTVLGNFITCLTMYEIYYTYLFMRLVVSREGVCTPDSESQVYTMNIGPPPYWILHYAWRPCQSDVVVVIIIIIIIITYHQSSVSVIGSKIETPLTMSIRSVTLVMMAKDHL